MKTWSPGRLVAWSPGRLVAWSRAHAGWLRQFLVLKNGIPSADTFLRIFRLLDPKQFERCFRQWVSGIIPNLSGTIAVDGKTVRGSCNGGETAIHMVSAFATRLGLVLGQEKAQPESPVALVVGQTDQVVGDSDILCQSPWSGGGNIGLATRWFAEIFPESSIVVVELDSGNFDILEKNIEALGVRVLALKGEIWDKPAKLLITNPEAGAAAFWVEDVDVMTSTMYS